MDVSGGGREAKLTDCQPPGLTCAQNSSALIKDEFTHQRNLKTFSENFYWFSFLPFHELYEIKHIVKGNIECKMKRLHSLLKHLIRLHTNGSKKKKRCEGFSTLITQKLLNTMWELTKAQSPPPQLIAKSYFKPDECKVICTQLIAMGTELQPSPPTIRALTIVSFKGLAIEFTESIYMMCCVNVTDTTAEERRWLWKRVGESSSHLLQLGVKVGNNGGGGVWSVQTQQKLSGFPCCTFTRTKTLLGGSDPRLLGWRGAEIHTEAKEEGLCSWFTPFSWL